MTNKKRYIYSLLTSDKIDYSAGGELCDSYGFIANNYYTMSKDELKDIILELDYALSRTKDGSYADVAEELKDRWNIYTSNEQAFGVGDTVTCDFDSPQKVLIVKEVIVNDDGTYSYIVSNADGYTKEIEQDDLSEA